MSPSLTMNDMIRRPTDQFSPKSSPRGSRSPVVPRQDSTGMLKTTISLGKTPAIVHSGPFYLMKHDAPSEAKLTGATNLISYHDLEHTYNKFCTGKKLKDSLASFVPNLAGNMEQPLSGGEAGSLRSLIEKPPICGKEVIPLTPNQLTGFRLHPGPLPEQYRVMMTPFMSKKKKKQKKEKRPEESTPQHEGSTGGDPMNGDAGGTNSALHEKKHGKKRKHEEDREKKKKKKEKKKSRKQKHSPDHPGSGGGPGMNPLLGNPLSLGMDRPL